MNKLLEELIDEGCDIDGGLHRFLDNEQMYMKYILDVPGNASFAELEAAMQAMDVEKVFLAAHSLKGNYATLGLSSLYERVVPVVEIARAKKTEGLKEAFEALKNEYIYMSSIINEYKGN